MGNAIFERYLRCREEDTLNVPQGTPRAPYPLLLGIISNLTLL
jgi:hypothetical protein